MLKTTFSYLTHRWSCSN